MNTSTGAGVSQKLDTMRGFATPLLKMLQGGGGFKGFFDAVGGVVCCRKKMPVHSFSLGCMQCECAPYCPIVPHSVPVACDVATPLYGVRLVAAITRIHLLFFEKPGRIPFVEKREAFSPAA